MPRAHRFELLGSQGKVSAQFVTGSADASLLHRQLAAYFSEAFFLPEENVLESAWDAATGDEVLAIEFGLAREFIRDTLVGNLPNIRIEFYSPQEFISKLADWALDDPDGGTVEKGNRENARLNLKRH